MLLSRIGAPEHSLPKPNPTWECITRPPTTPSVSRQLHTAPLARYNPGGLECPSTPTVPMRYTYDLLLKSHTQKTWPELLF